MFADYTALARSLARLWPHDPTQRPLVGVDRSFISHEATPADLPRTQGYYVWEAVDLQV